MEKITNLALKIMDVCGWVAVTGFSMFQLLYWVAPDIEVGNIYVSGLIVITEFPSGKAHSFRGGSKKLREEFSHLQHLPSLWTRSYFVSTAGNVSSETIKRYVEQQKTRG